MQYVGIALSETGLSPESHRGGCCGRRASAAPRRRLTVAMRDERRCRNNASASRSCCGHPVSRAASFVEAACWDSSRSVTDVLSLTMNFTVRPCGDRLGSSVVPFLAAVGCVLVLAPSGCSRSSGASAPVAPEPLKSLGEPAAVPSAGSSTYTLMQMNLCLSGLAGCYGKAAYPAVVEEAVARIREAGPDAVTFNEACRSDIARIARRTGYHLRFSRVIYRGERLRCVRPGGRGLYGDALLTEAAIESTDSQDFEAQAGIERRRWLCVTTRVDVDVCTAHLNTRTTIEVAGNDAQCVE